MNNKQNIDIEAIKTRANAATPGPWTSGGCARRINKELKSVYVTVGANEMVRNICHGSNENDADFIAHAPEDVAALLAEIERLTAELDTTNRRYNEINRYNVSCTKQCDKLLLENTDLKERLSSSIAECNALREDFTKYAKGGTTDPSPYCANKAECIADDGWCILERCDFRPNACETRTELNNGSDYHIENLTAQLDKSQRRERDARNELCQRCGRYHEAHNGACDGCRRKETEQ